MAAGISISALPNGNALTGTEQVPVVQNGVTIKVTAAQIAALGGGGSGGGVTNVAIIAAHGFTGTVALPSTTPAITLSVNGVVGVLKSDGLNLQPAVPGTDYVTPGLITASNLSANTARILGRTTAAAGNIEEITIGSGLLLSAGTLVATASGGSVTTVSVATANGLAGTVATATTTPVITLRTSLTANVVKANGTALIAAVAATDYVGPGATTTSGLTMTTARILGRTTASTGAIEEITVGSGLSLSAGTLVATASGGSVTSVSVTTGNGFAGTVSTASTTPAILLSTTVTGLLKGNGTTISAALAGTDYYVPGGVLGTPSSGVATNLTGIPAPNLVGNLAIARFNSGTSASSTTFWRGDSTWAVPAGGGGGTINITGGNLPRPTTQAQLQSLLQTAANNGQSVMLDPTNPTITLTSTMTISMPNAGFQFYGNGLQLTWGGPNDGATPAMVFQATTANCTGVVLQGFKFFGNAFSTSGCGNGLTVTSTGSSISLYNFVLRDIKIEFCGANAFEIDGTFESSCYNLITNGNRGHGINWENGSNNVTTQFFMYSCQFSRNNGYGARQGNGVDQISWFGSGFVNNGLGGILLTSGGLLIDGCCGENTGLALVTKTGDAWGPTMIRDCQMASDNSFTRGGVPASQISRLIYKGSPTNTIIVNGVLRPYAGQTNMAIQEA